MRRGLLLAAMLGALAVPGAPLLAEGQLAAPAAALATIEPAELAARLAKGDVVLVDVRSPQEFSEGHIAGAINMPLDSFDPAAVPIVAGKETILYCRSGKRSAMAAAKMAEAGIAPARYLAGGTLAWTAAGLPLLS